jgi:Trypsin-co-occurring domain 2
MYNASQAIGEEGHRRGILAGESLPEESLADEGIPLSRFLAGLRHELLKAQADAQARDDDWQRLRLSVGPVTVEFTLAATHAKDGKGGIEFYVFKLGGGASASSVSTQRVTLTLTPTTGDGDQFQVTDSSLRKEPE